MRRAHVGRDGRGLTVKLPYLRLRLHVGAMAVVDLEMFARPDPPVEPEPQGTVAVMDGAPLGFTGPSRPYDVRDAVRT